MSYDPDFATFVHLYKRYQLSAGHQNPTPVPAQRPPGQRPSLARPQQVPYQQAPQRNALELAILRALDDIRRMFDEFKRELESVLVAVNELRNQSADIKAELKENMERMQGNIERFEVVGRNFLLALQSSSSQPLVSPHHPEPSQHASQQAPSNLSKTYNQGPNTTQPPTFAPHPSQFLYDPNFTEFENFLSGDN